MKLTQTEKTLIENGFQCFQHNSGFIAWSIQNLCEVSDEWEKIPLIK